MVLRCKGCAMSDYDHDALQAQRERELERVNARIEAKRAASTDGYNGARSRAGTVARVMLDHGATIERATEVADRVFSDALDVALGDKRIKPATAAKLTREIRNGDRAVAYADRQEVTGALHSSRMRVKARSGASATHDRPASYPTDACAARLDSARTVAARDLEHAIHAFRSGRNGAAKDAARGKIRAILHTWDGDSVIRETAIAAKWRL